VSSDYNTVGRAAVLAQYDGFALQARSAAAGEPLDNVRQKHLTSAMSWEQLAANGRKWEAQRIRRLAEERSAKDTPPTPAAKPMVLGKIYNVKRSPLRLAGRSGILIG
jgi:hypothetical protein